MSKPFCLIYSSKLEKNQIHKLKKKIIGHMAKERTLHNPKASSDQILQQSLRNERLPLTSQCASTRFSFIWIYIITYVHNDFNPRRRLTCFIGFNLNHSSALGTFRGTTLTIQPVYWGRGVSSIPCHERCSPSDIHTGPAMLGELAAWKHRSPHGSPANSGEVELPSDRSLSK